MAGWLADWLAGWLAGCWLAERKIEKGVPRTSHMLDARWVGGYIYIYIYI